MNETEFRMVFKQLTGHEPLRWQVRLFVKHFAYNDQDKVPRTIDLPTGLGKTMVMAIWLIARATNPSVPRRLVYVVDRRTVVDQATYLAMTLIKNWCKNRVLPGEPPAISTLRGQLADNREWSRDPSRPAIIIGTVDLIGSALLFSGYRSSYKRRPLEAGLLGQDSLLVLDEAHLSKPFEKLLGAIEQFNNRGSASDSPVRALRVIRMSATSGESDTDSGVFRLDTDPQSKNYDLRSEWDEQGQEKNQIKRRFEAIKRLTIRESNDANTDIPSAANELAENHRGSRIAIFVRSPKDVREVRTKLMAKNNAFATAIAQLTGTMRGLERDELVSPPTTEEQHERRVMQRFLTPDNVPSEGTCFLISTSAGEVGFDLNADHMVCDATTIDSLIQRLGRVNRRGHGEANIILVREPLKMKDGKPIELKGVELAIANTISLLQDVEDVSPKHLAALKASDA